MWKIIFGLFVCLFLLKKRGKILEPQFMAGNLIGLFPDWNKSATAARRINNGV
jgi:hypothetical protein